MHLLLSKLRALALSVAFVGLLVPAAGCSDEHGCGAMFSSTRYKEGCGCVDATEYGAIESCTPYTPSASPSSSSAQLPPPSMSIDAGAEDADAGDPEDSSDAGGDAEAERDGESTM